MEDDSLTMLAALSSNFPNILIAVKYAFYTIGTVLVIVGLHFWGSGGGANRGQHSHGSGVIASLLLGGALMLSLPSLITIAGASIGLGSDPRLALSAVQVNRANPLGMVAAVVFNLAAIIGYIAAGRGVYAFAMAGSQKEDKFWHGASFLFAGAVLVNLPYAMQILARSVGATQLASFISDLT
jgi:hypothetical protein